MRLLLVEDNRDLARWLAEILRAGRYDVDVAHDGEEAEGCLAATAYGLMILDLGLPRMGGGEVLRRLRARRSMMPVIVLTADGSLDARIAGLDGGADDYLTKPFEVAELEARVRAQLRRSAGQADAVIRCEDLAFDTVGRSLTLKAVGLALTPPRSGRAGADPAARWASRPRRSARAWRGSRSASASGCSNGRRGPSP